MRVQLFLFQPSKRTIQLSQLISISTFLWHYIQLSHFAALFVLVFSRLILHTVKKFIPMLELKSFLY